MTCERQSTQSDNFYPGKGRRGRGGGSSASKEVTLRVHKFLKQEMRAFLLLFPPDIKEAHLRRNI